MEAAVLMVWVSRPFDFVLIYRSMSFLFVTLLKDFLRLDSVYSIFVHFFFIWGSTLWLVLALLFNNVHRCGEKES